MRKKFNRVLGTVCTGALTLSMLMGSALPVLAQSPEAVEGQCGEQTDLYKDSEGKFNLDGNGTAVTGTITVSGISEDDVKTDEEGNKIYPTITAYQLVDGHYTTDEDGKIYLDKYVLIDPENAPINAISGGIGGQHKDTDDNNTEPPFNTGVTGDYNDIISYEEITRAENAVRHGDYTAQPTDRTKKVFETSTATEYEETGDDGLTHKYYSFTADLEPGLYLILVDGVTDEWTYNPAVAAVNISDAAKSVAEQEELTEGGTVNMANYFTTLLGGDPHRVYVKSSNSPFDKKITGSIKHQAVAEEDNKLEQELEIRDDKGDTVAFGDTVQFQIDGMKIPTFSITDETTSDDFGDAADKMHYYITDTLYAEGFGTIRNLRVYINDVLTKPGEETFHVTDLNGENNVDSKVQISNQEEGPNTSDPDTGLKEFKISFTENFIRNHNDDTQRPTVRVTYESVLLSTAGLNYSENENHAELKWKNNPNEDEHTLDKTTYHYTFGIDAAINGKKGEGEPDKEETHEFNKVTEGGKTYIEETDTTTITENATWTWKSPEALAGATFTLYRDEDCTVPVKARRVNEETGEVTVDETTNYTATSNSNGHFSFIGLDEGTYYMKETDPPQGYTLSDAVYRFVIKADIDQNTGVMTKYSITTSYKSDALNVTDWAEAGSAVYESKGYNTGENGKVTHTEITKTVIPMEVVDSTLPHLPSTGGEGIVRFLIIAAVFAAAFITFTVVTRNRRKD